MYFALSIVYIFSASVGTDIDQAMAQPASGSTNQHEISSKYPQENHHAKFSDLEHNMSSSNIIQGFNEVSQGRDLEDYMDPENGLLRRLSEHKIITHSDMKSLAKVLTPYQLLNGELLNRIRPNIDLICQQFMKAPCDDEQDHIAKFIISSGRNTDSDDRLLPRAIEKNYR